MEGALFVIDALRSGTAVLDLFVTEDAERLDEVLVAAGESGVEVTFVPDQIMRSMADAVTPQGVLAVAEIPAETPALLERADLVLVLAAVRDPGNAGTLIRSAVAAGADAVVFASGSVDPFSPKTVRSAAGSIFSVPVILAKDDDWIGHLRAGGVSLVGADGEADESMYEADLSGPVALVVGNEAWGLPSEVRRSLDATVRIPMPGPVGSLNAAVAGSLLLFEAVRQRGLGSAHDD